VPEPGGKALVIRNPDSLREILLERQKQFRKPETQVTDDVRQIMGRGLITSQGEEWKKRHRLLMPHFRDQSVEQMKPQAEDEAEKLVERWSREGFHSHFTRYKN